MASWAKKDAFLNEILLGEEIWGQGSRRVKTNLELRVKQQIDDMCFQKDRARRTSKEKSWGSAERGDEHEEGKRGEDHLHSHSLPCCRGGGRWCCGVEIDGFGWGAIFNQGK